ncbi:hypothetical protein BDR03DRAFT_1012541 [Suillus americanus]|nr:hypothetical protein BDR03DRAFT_1012541 [Suillus americanus]
MSSPPHCNPPHSSSSHPNPPRSSHPSSLARTSPPIMDFRSPSPALSSDPGSPTDRQDELEAALISARSMPRLVLDPPTSPETGSWRPHLPTSPPQPLDTEAALPARLATKCPRGGGMARKGKGKEKAPEPKPAKKLYPLPHLPKPAPSFWASLAASSASSALTFSGSPLVPSPSIPSIPSSSSSAIPPPLLSAFSGPPAFSPTLPPAPAAPFPSPLPSALSGPPAFSPAPPPPAAALSPSPTIASAPALSADQVLSLLQHPWLNALLANHPLVAPGPVHAPSDLLPAPSSGLKARVHGLPPLDPLMQLDPNNLIDHGLVVHILKEGWQTYFPINSLSVDLTRATLHYAKAPTDFDIVNEPSISYPDFCKAARMLPVLIGRHLNSPFKAEIADSFHKHYEGVLRAHDF